MTNETPERCIPHESEILGDGVMMELGGHSGMWVLDGHAYAPLVGRSPHGPGFQVVALDPCPELDHLIPAELRGDPGRDESREGAERL